MVAVDVLFSFQNLELQQQLAVAVSTDRKKDGMIQQLDKVRIKCMSIKTVTSPW